jgi:protein-S-isoprenylcysteine O-methyltransferase Ste14
MPERLAPEFDLSRTPDHPLPPSTGLVLRHCAVSIVLYGALLGFVILNPWFKGLLRIRAGGVTAASIYLLLYLAYVVLAPTVYLILRPRSLHNSKNLLLAALFGRLVKRLGSAVGRRPGAPLAVSYRETHALAFLLIKLFFGPLMLNAAFEEWNQIRYIVRQFNSDTLWTTLDGGFLIFVSAVFLLDAFIFFVGYHTEAKILRNEVRYVETRPLAILVCLACYPPFNLPTLNLLGPSFDNPRIVVLGEPHGILTWALRIAAAGCLLLLLCASYSLFTRASNLTNRGIVTWGPYRFIRHPGYLAKNLFWLMTILPVLIANPATPGFSWGHYLIFAGSRVCGFAAWCSLYVLRALTEEQLLSRDPEYRAYCQEVKWRFIPGVW